MRTKPNKNPNVGTPIWFRAGNKTKAETVFKLNFYRSNAPSYTNLKAIDRKMCVGEDSKVFPIATYNYISLPVFVIIIFKAQAQTHYFNNLIH